MAAEVPEVLSRWFWLGVILAMLWAPVAIVELVIDGPVDLVTHRVSR